MRKRGGFLERKEAERKKWNEVGLPPREGME